MNRLIEYIPGSIWLKEYPIRFAGCRFNARMTVVRLSDDRLLVHSPSPIDADTKAEIDALGTVGVIVAPGNYHYLNVDGAQKAFPDAEVYLCPGVEKKDPTLAHRKLIGDAAEPCWSADLDHVVIRGSSLIQEIAYYHRASATLILVDAIENFGDETPGVGGLLRLWWGLLRMWNKARPAPEYQLSWSDKSAAKRSFERILEWDFERIVLAHGDLIETNAQAVARSAWQRVLATPSADAPGHYSRVRQAKLVHDLSDTLSLMDDTLNQQFGVDTAARMKTQVLTEFEILLPDIPVIPNAAMMNFFLLVTAQEVAAFRALQPFSLAPNEIWLLCHKALRLATAQIPAWKKWLLRKMMFSTLVHLLMERRARKGTNARLGDFEIEYLSSVSEPFDLGVNYRQCANHKFALAHGAKAFAPYICMSDIALSEAFGWGLKRTQTLADGCSHCDFRMTEGGPTVLTSHTPEVQRTIEKIRAIELSG